METWKFQNKFDEQTNQFDHSYLLSVLDDDSGTIIDPLAIAETFNNYFTDTGPNLARHFPDPTCDPMSFLKQTMHNFKLKYISPECIANTIHKSPSKKAACVNKIPCSVLKSAADITWFGENNL